VGVGWTRCRRRAVRALGFAVQRAFGSVLLRACLGAREARVQDGADARVGEEAREVERRRRHQHDHDGVGGGGGDALEQLELAHTHKGRPGSSMHLALGVRGMGVWCIWRALASDGGKSTWPDESASEVASAPSRAQSRSVPAWSDNARWSATSDASEGEVVRPSAAKWPASQVGARQAPNEAFRCSLMSRWRPELAPRRRPLLDHAAVPSTRITVSAARARFAASSSMPEAMASEALAAQLGTPLAVVTRSAPAWLATASTKLGHPAPGRREERVSR